MGILISVQWSDNGTFVKDLLWILSACVVDFSHFTFIYVPTQENITFKWACALECLVMRFSGPFLSHLVIITAWRTEVMETPMTFLTFCKLSTDQIAAFNQFAVIIQTLFIHMLMFFSIEPFPNEMVSS